jgi:hypothetical protein
MLLFFDGGTDAAPRVFPSIQEDAQALMKQFNIQTAILENIGTASSSDSGWLSQT